MDLNPLLGIVSTFIVHVPCSAIILVKFPQLSPQFISERQKASNLFDPLTDFGLVSRQMLCDAVINAKQFSAHYNRAYYQAMLGVKVPMVSRTEWDDPSIIPFGITNYQRLLPMFETQNLASLRYVPRPLKFGKGGYDKVKTIQCVGTTNVHWYITFGFVDHFMYLLERRTHKLDSSLRISGLLEPSPVVSNLPEDYFYSQLLSPKIRRMEKICEVGLNDHIRLCGAILDVLSSKGSLDRRVPQINLVRSRVRLCLWKDIVSPQQPTKSAKVLRCIFHYKKEEWTPFYVLADVVEPGAVFVFLEGKDGNLYLHIRLTRITALLYPVGAKGKGVKSNKRASSRGGANQPNRKKRRITRNSDNNTEEDDESQKQGKGKQIEERGSEGLIKAEHSEEDADNEDYIMSLLAGGKVKEEEFSQEDDDIDGAGDYSKGTSKVIKQEMKEGLSSDGQPVAELRTYVHRKARSKGRNEQRTNKDVPKKSSSNNQPREQKNKKDHDDQDTDYIYSRTRSRSKAMPEKRKEPMVTDDEEDKDHTSSRDSESEDDTEDDDYNLDEDFKINLEDEDYEYSEDIEEEKSCPVGSGSGTKDKQRNKEREKGSRGKKGKNDEVHSLSKAKIKKEQDTGESEGETSIRGKTRHKILQTEEVQEYCSEEDAGNDDRPCEEDTEDEDFRGNENNDSGGDSATLCDVGKHWREKRRRSSRKRPKRDELSPSPPRNKGKEILDEVESERDDSENDDVDIAKGTYKDMREIEAVYILEQMRLLKGPKWKRGKRLRRKTGQKKRETGTVEIGDASRRTKKIAADPKGKSTASVSEQEEFSENEDDLSLTSSEDLDNTNLSKTKKQKRSNTHNR